MKVCLVLVVCMLALIPATTAITVPAMEVDLQELDIDDYVYPPETEKMTFRIKDYKTSSCKCTALKSHTSTLGAEVWRGSTCTSGAANQDGFECALSYGAVYRWRPVDTCTTSCTASGYDCNSEYGIDVRYCLLPLNKRQNAATFCPCEQ